MYNVPSKRSFIFEKEFKIEIMIEKLKINVVELSKFRSSQMMLYARCGVTGRDLYINLMGSYELWIDGSKVFTTNDTYEAVQAFNTHYLK